MLYTTLQLHALLIKLSASLSSWSHLYDSSGGLTNYRLCFDYNSYINNTGNKVLRTLPRPLKSARNSKHNALFRILPIPFSIFLDAPKCVTLMTTVLPITTRPKPNEYKRWKLTMTGWRISKKVHVKCLFQEPVSPHMYVFAASF